MTAARICIVGPGAIGGWLAARLALAGEDVSVLARGAALERIRKHGLELHSAGGRDVVPVRACATAGEVGPQDIVFVTVKAPALPALAPSLRELLHEGSTLLSAGNGLPWWYLLGPDRPLGGRRLHSVDPLGETEGSIVLGEPGGGISARVTDVAGRLQAAGFDAQASDDIRRDIWNKLLGNACFNPVSLITGSSNDGMLGDPALHGMFMRMMQEAIEVGERLGLRLDVDPAQRIAQAGRLGNIKTSMLQDLEAGRSPEIEPIEAHDLVPGSHEAPAFRATDRPDSCWLTSRGQGGVIHAPDPTLVRARLSVLLWHRVVVRVGDLARHPGEVKPRWRKHIDQPCATVVDVVAGVDHLGRDHGQRRAADADVFVVAPGCHVGGPRMAQVVHPVTAERQ